MFVSIAFSKDSQSNQSKTRNWRSQQKSYDNRSGSDWFLWKLLNPEPNTLFSEWHKVHIV